MRRCVCVCEAADCCCLCRWCSLNILIQIKDPLCGRWAIFMVAQSVDARACMSVGRRQLPADSFFFSDKSEYFIHHFILLVFIMIPLWNNAQRCFVHFFHKDWTNCMSLVRFYFFLICSLSYSIVSLTAFILSKPGVCVCACISFSFVSVCCFFVEQRICMIECFIFHDACVLFVRLLASSSSSLIKFVRKIKMISVFALPVVANHLYGKLRLLLEAITE